MDVTVAIVVIFTVDVVVAVAFDLLLLSMWLPLWRQSAANPRAPSDQAREMVCAEIADKKANKRAKTESFRREESHT